MAAYVAPAADRDRLGTPFAYHAMTGTNHPSPAPPPPPGQDQPQSAAACQPPVHRPITSYPSYAPLPFPHPHPRVKISPKLQLLISDLCSRLDVDGLRGDLVVNRAAKALVAYEGRTEVTQEDVERVVSGCLNHRWGARGVGGGGDRWVGREVGCRLLASGWLLGGQGRCRGWGGGSWLHSS